MEKFGIGQPVRRKEDQRFITGTGCYIADQKFDGELRAVVVRSPYAAARITAIDVEDARAAPGVAAVLTGADIRAAGLGPIPCIAQINTTDGKGLSVPERMALAEERVRFVGDPVAFVVAETLAEASDAAELVMVDYEPDDSVSTLDAALADGAPLVWPERGSNVAFHFQRGDGEATDKALAGAEHVVTLDLVNNRIAPVPIETRGVVGLYDAGEDHYTLHTSGMGAHGQRGQLANAVFKIAPEKLHVVMPDVGGGFGAKNFVYPEMVLALHAAKVTGRPVKWLGDRAESFLSDAHARDHTTTGTLGLTKDGLIEALKIETRANMGGYLNTFGPHIPTNAMSSVVGGPYVIPAIAVDVTGVFTHTVPVDAYRGAGRPEANYVLERLIEIAARRLGLEPDEIRRRNLITSFPYDTAIGTTIDCGGFAENLSIALDSADKKGFESRRAQAAKTGRLRGLGVACYLESTLGMPNDGAKLSFVDGGLEIAVGTQSNGAGHETAFAQIVHEILGVPFERISFVQADTDRTPAGGGHGGSRSLSTGGMALFHAAETLREKARKAAAHLLEAAEADIEIANGRCTVAGTDKSVAILDLPQALEKAGAAPEGLEEGLDTLHMFQREGISYPNGVHAAEVEIDPETGVMRLERYTVADDFGRVVNPLLVTGQVQGGVAQGVGQAMMEMAAYDSDGQLVSGTFMDYTLPRADDLPDVDVILNQNAPTGLNPLGIKGCGEAGCTGAPAAVVNAVCDALKGYGVEHIDMPLTPQRIWQVIREHQS